MALTFLEAKVLIESGRAESTISQFIRTALQTAVEAGANDRATTPEQDNAMVAAMALQLLLETPDGRRALKLPRRPRGNSYDADKYLYESPWVQALGLSVYLGYVTRIEASKALGNWLAQQNQYPDAKTLDSLVDDIAKRMEGYSEMVAYLRRAAGGDTATIEDVQKKVEAVLGRKEAHHDK